MTSLKQIDANRRNAPKSTGPTSEVGKERSRQNAMRHGLTAETVVEPLENREDYKAFEMSITVEFDAQTAVERELVLRLASVFWRRDTGVLQKIAATSSEACGISYAEMRRGKLQTRTYFDGQADREQRWPDGALPEDGLPAALRTYVTGLLPVNLQVFPSLLAGRYADLAPRTYNLERRAVPGGAGAAGWSAGDRPTLCGHARDGRHAACRLSQRLERSGLYRGPQPRD